MRFKATDVKAADGVLKRPMFDAKRPMVGVNDASAAFWSESG